MRLARTPRSLISAIAAILFLTFFAVPAGQAGAAAAEAAARALRTGVRLPSGARLTSVDRVGDRTIDVTLSSPALGGAGHARILVPPGFDESGRRLPVLYVLHGCCGHSAGWTEWTDNTRIEELTAGYPALVVMPEAGPNGFYSNWWNGGRYGPPRWEDFHLIELRELLEKGLRAGSDRAVAGLSMGGFGALSYSARHPWMFQAAASYSGMPDALGAAANVQAVVAALGADPDALWGDPEEQQAIWRMHNPSDLVSRLRGIPLYVAAGNGTTGPLDPVSSDQPDPVESWVGPMNERFVDKARASGVRVTANLYGPGTHTWPYWERELRSSLPMLMGAIGARST